MLRKILLSLLSALLMSLPWVFPSGILASIAVCGSFFGFVPLLKLQKELNGKGFVKFALLTYLIFNIICISWISQSAVIGVFAAILVYLVIFGVITLIYNYVWQKAKKPLAYVIFVCGWLAAERFYNYSEISFPWLNIGNSMAQNPYIIQWIEYTGVSGVALWALITNLVVFEMIEAKGVVKTKFKIALATIMVVPMIVSLFIFFNYNTEGSEKVNVTILQPNIDPYNEKFGGLSAKQQEDILVDLMKNSPKSTQYFVAPETALDRGFYIHALGSNSTIKRLRNTLKDISAEATYVGGLTTYKIYNKPLYTSAPTTTARENDNYYYDVYNSSICIDSTLTTPLYHKVKLVIGVEMLPYHEHLQFINNLSVSLGGISGMLGSSERAEVFTNSSDSTLKVASAICYESLYGEYFSEFVREGAKTMFIITNDGWWGNTFGYHQHLMFARLRAIENRRSISRSANTGISAFIDERGCITKDLGWDKRGIINSDVTINNKLTFFVKNGDIIGRAAKFTFLLCILYFIAYIRKKKDHII